MSFRLEAARQNAAARLGSWLAVIAMEISEMKDVTFRTAALQFTFSLCIRTGLEQQHVFA